MNFFSSLRHRWQAFLHNDELKGKIYSIVFESDTPKGKLFDILLIGSIILSVLLVILESMHIFPYSAYLVLRILEYLLTFFFTIEYLARIYCLKEPRKYIFIIAVPTGIVSATMVNEHKKSVHRRCPRCKREESDPAAVFCKFCGTRLKKDKQSTERKERVNDERF